MSGLARIALSHGITVSGSDAKDSSVVTALSALGATVATTHNAANVDGADLVVYSNAIAANHPERMRAAELHTPTLTRAAALSVLMSESKSVAVAGTHGKTTNSWLMFTVISALMEFTANFTYVVAITNLDLAKVGIIISTSSIFATLVAIPVMKQRPRLINWIGIMIATLSLALVALA